MNKEKLNDAFGKMGGLITRTLDYKGIADYSDGYMNACKVFGLSAAVGFGFSWILKALAVNEIKKNSVELDEVNEVITNAIED